MLAVAVMWGGLAVPAVRAGPRTVSLSPNLTELVFALGFGSNLVGRSTACDYPPGAEILPTAGDFGRPNLEQLERLRPDLVLVTDLERPGFATRVQSLGATCLRLPCESWTQLLEAAHTLAEAMGEPSRGTAWVDAMQARRAALAERVAAHAPAQRPLVYAEIWGDPLTTAARNSALHELVELAGCRNLGGTLAGTYKHASAEWVVAGKPDVILLAYMLPAAVPAREQVTRRPGWRGVPAVRDGRICDTIHPDLLLRAGPRWIEGAEAFADYLNESSNMNAHRRVAEDAEKRR